MKNLKIRLTTERDFSQLVTLAEEFLPHEANRKQRISTLKQALQDARYELLIADSNGEIVGFIDQWFLDDFSHGAPLSYIQSLFVTSPHRRKGIAASLLQAAIQHAETRGVREMHLSAEINNTTAISLYKKYGFTKEHIQLEKEFI